MPNGELVLGSKVFKHDVCFVDTVSGIEPTLDYHLVTKNYVDEAIAGFSTSHSDLINLYADDHKQYVLADGTRPIQSLLVSGLMESDGVRLNDGQWYGPDPVSGFPTGTTHIIDWDDGNAQALDLESVTGTTTLTFSNGQHGASYILEVIQDSTVARDITWPVNVKWPDGLTPVVSAGSRATDIFTFYFNGMNYFGNRGPNYGP